MSLQHLPSKESKRISFRESLTPSWEKRVRSIPSTLSFNVQNSHLNVKDGRRNTVSLGQRTAPNIHHQSNSLSSEEGRRDSRGKKRRFTVQEAHLQQPSIISVLPEIEPNLEPLLQAHVIDHILISYSAFSDSSTLIKQNKNQSLASFASESHSFSTPPQQQSPEFPGNHLSPGSFPRIPPAITSRPEHAPSIDTESSEFPDCSTEFGFQDRMTLEQSRHEDIGELWDFTNGFRIAAHQGKRFCLKMTSAATEDPIYILSTSTQAFYSLKLNIRSDTTKISMIRYDPTKNARVSFLGFSKFDKGTEVLCTTIQESARHYPPKDGLVAVLYPKAASKMFIENASKISLLPKNDDYIATVNNECGRLIWDEDAGSYYLVHSAMRVPFSITLSSHPGSSTVKYMLEHTELPRDMVTLIKDSNGNGFLEIDTSCAARVPSSYIIDVVVFALMLVALAEEIAIGPIELSKKFTSLSNRVYPPMPSRIGQHQASQATTEEEDMESRSMDLKLDLERRDITECGYGNRRQSLGLIGLIRMLVRSFLQSIGIILGSSKEFPRK